MSTSKLSSLFLAAALALTGCAKSTDLGRMQEETLSIVKLHATEIEVLQRRADALMARGRNLGGNAPGIADAGRLLSEARAELDKLRAQLTGVSSVLGNAVKSGEGDEVQRASDETLEKLEEGEIAVRANLAAVENWLMNAENRTLAAAVPPARPAVDEKPVAAVPTFETKLSTGAEIKGNADGLEIGLLGFLQDAKRPVDKTTWFDFDRLVFQTGSAELDAAKSKPQLDNLTAILAAFPTAKLKIGGYTDNTGTPAANKTLSQARADHVKAALVAGGVKADRLEAEGFGSDFPICAANDTDECKAKNRRISVRVTAK